MNGAPHRFLVASAGSGKTYELTSRLLALIFDGRELERVLATTFMRKAAREIVERVVSRLVAAATHDERRAELAVAIGRDVTREQCLAVLAALVKRLDRLRVSTLDAYFSRIARLHAFELGLPAAWTIADDDVDLEVMSDAVARALEHSSSEERLPLLRDLHGGSGRVTVHGALLRTMREGRAAFLESAAEAWDRVDPGHDVSVDDLERACAAITRLVAPPTKKGTPDGRWGKALETAQRCVAARDWSALRRSGLLATALAGEFRYYGAEFPADWRDVFAVLADHVAFLEIAALARENRASRQLLERFEPHYRALQRELGLLRFEDLPASIAPLDAHDPLAARGIDASHRLDGAIDHLLLDEFQDTSPVQWRVLAPIARRIVDARDGSRTFFCVGDPKQSIYGWRAAEPRLVEHARSSLDLASEPLTRSWRSAQVVLDTVHRVFGEIARNEAIVARDEPRVVRAAQSFATTYAHHRAARTDLRGATFLLEARPSDEQKADDAVLELAARRVAALHAEAPHATIGVLLRGNADAAALIHRLRLAGVRASGEGGNPLTDSTAVLATLSLLWLADHPADTASAFHVATSPLGARVGLRADADDASRRSEARSVARSLRRALADRGLGVWIAALVHDDAPEWSAWDRRRLGQLVDLALAFEPRAGSRASAFVEHVRAQRVEDPSSAGVRVMTVHKSKGLEFDAVVLPDLEGSMLKTSSRFETSRSNPAGAIDVVSRPLEEALSSRSALLARLHDETVARRVEEELCVLYVAMTRAKHRLEMIVAPPPKSGSSKSLTFASILRASLSGTAVDRGDHVELWSHADNSADWAPRPAAPNVGSATEPDGQLVLARSSRARTLESRSPSSVVARRARTALDLLGEDGAGALRGTLVHRWLAEVEWIESFERTDAELTAIVHDLGADAAVVRSALSDLRGALSSAFLRDALARPAGDVECWRERRFALVLPGEGGGEELWTGAFDRVVVRREHGRAVAAEIVDFKTDCVEGAALDDRATTYAPQIQAYRRVLAAMLALPPTAIRARLLFLHARRAVEVAPAPR